VPEALVRRWAMGSPGETRAWGSSLGHLLRGGEVIALYGPVGAGKTVLISGILTGMGIQGPVPSPTFVLARQYRLDELDVLHLDLYRLSPPEVESDLPWDEIPGPDRVVLVEWAERAGAVLPHERLDVRLVRPKGGFAPGEITCRGRRDLVCTAYGSHHASILRELGPFDSPGH